jgi:hypothetical protein
LYDSFYSTFGYHDTCIACGLPPPPCWYLLSYFGLRYGLPLYLLASSDSVSFCSKPSSLNDCPIYLYLTHHFYFRPFAITFQIAACATYVSAPDFFMLSFLTFKDPETGVMLRPLAYLVSRTNLYLYSATMCTTRPLLPNYLPIWDSMDLAIILILSSYFLFCVTVLTFLISLSFSHSCCPSYSESPLLYPVHVSQFLLFAYDSFCYDYYTILHICQLITEQLMHHLQLLWLGL